jgi:hypothetical protein
MPGKTPEPWYRESKRAWFVCINGKQHRLGKHKEEAHRRFHLLMAGETPTPTHGKAGQQSGENGGERHGASTAKQTATLTVDRLATAYLTEAGRRLSATPYRVASWMVRTFTSRYGNLPADDVRKHHVETWVEKHPRWGASTENLAKTRIGAMYRWAVEQGLIAANPIQGIRKPSIKEPWKRSRDFRRHARPTDGTRLSRPSGRAVRPSGERGTAGGGFKRDGRRLLSSGRRVDTGEAQDGPQDGTAPDRLPNAGADGVVS